MLDVDWPNSNCLVGVQNWNEDICSSYDLEEEEKCNLLADQV